MDGGVLRVRPRMPLRGGGKIYELGITGNFKSRLLVLVPHISFIPLNKKKFGSIKYAENKLFLKITNTDTIYK